MMAATARSEEATSWTAAGIRPRAVVADVGCGPGAMLRQLAEAVGAEGRADGVDQSAGAVAAASGEVGDLPQASVRQGEATDTRLPPGSYDVVMLRHVLAHNGGQEAAIVSHLAELVRPGGAVYLVDVDIAAMWIQPIDIAVEDLQARYHAYHAQRGNNLSVGRLLGALLQGAGLGVEIFRCGGPVLQVPPGMRGPAWAARDALVAADLATPDDLARWDEGYKRMDELPRRPWISPAGCLAVGRRPE